MEVWDIYDRSGQMMDKQVERGAILGENEYHRVVHIWILNERREYLIQKRASHLKWNPNKWATTTGSVLVGEYDLLEAAYRELAEELGLDNLKIDIEFEKEVIIGQSIVTIFKGFLPAFMFGQIQLNHEVSEVKWAKKGKIEELRVENLFATYSDETFDIAYRIKLNMN